MFLSAFVLSFAISLFRTRTSGTPGSCITVVVGDVRETVLPGARVSHRPRKSFLERVVNFEPILTQRISLIVRLDS